MRFYGFNVGCWCLMLFAGVFLGLNGVLRVQCGSLRFFEVQ